MFFPIKTDRPLTRTPVVNYGLIAVNVLIFMLTPEASQAGWTYRFLLDPEAPGLLQFFTYQFLHADAWHLAGNMIFLYAFGNNVEDRLGRVGYLAFYLAGGVMAGLGHSLADAAPILGASGSVSAVTGAFLALFARSHITVVYFFIIIGAWEVPSMFLILFQVAQNLLFTFIGQGGVAYVAHLAGYGYGFIVGLALLAVRILPRDPYDFLSLFSHWRRRSTYRSLTRKGYSPWEHASPAGSDAPSARVLRTTDETDQPTLNPQTVQARVAIRNAVIQRDLASAASQYRRLLKQDGSDVFSQPMQLELANQFMTEADYEMAARAYELYLNTYPQADRIEEVQLILGLVYTRYQPRLQRARELLQRVASRLRDDEQKALAQRLLAEIG